MGLQITEIFESLQGESSYSGLPCLFIRTAGCNLRCSWCDTKYSYDGGREYTSNEILQIINSSKVRIVEFTGGEPLLQKDELIKIIENIDPDKTVLLETNGSISVEGIPGRVVKIIDIKLKGSGEGDSFLEDNLKFLTKKDEIKFVISDIFDYNEMRAWYKKYDLADKCHVLVSIVKGCSLTEKEIAEKILQDGLNVRFQIQLHKHIWKDEKGR